MFFKKEKTVTTIFNERYKLMKKITKLSGNAQDAEFELLPAMFVVIDYAAASCGKDRRVIANAVTSEIFNRHIDESKFGRRCDLYGEIIRGKDLRCEWFLGNDKTVFTDNAVLKCVALLCDIIYNPECADNYDHAPMRIYDIYDSMAFTEQVMKPLVDEFIALFKDIYEL